MAPLDRSRFLGGRSFSSDIPDYKNRGALGPEASGLESPKSWTLLSGLKARPTTHDLCEAAGRFVGRGFSRDMRLQISAALAPEV